MRTHMHIEREFSNYEVDFLWLEYHQVRFVSFAVWFIGLFLSDFTVLVSNPAGGWADVTAYLRVIAIIHLAFVLLFLAYLVVFCLRAASRPPLRRLAAHCLFDLSAHLDVAVLIFVAYFTPDTPAAMAAAHCLCAADAVLTAVLTPYKLWRAAVDVCGVEPCLIVAHCILTQDDPTISKLFVALPLAVVLLCPLLFTVAATAFSAAVPRAARRCIELLDPSLLPNQMAFARQLRRADPGDDAARGPPSILAAATSGGDDDYYDFKAVPFAIVATFLIHFGCFAAGTHSNSMVVMAHYFVMLAAVLINTRVVAFPSIVLTNVDPTVTFNTVWPELNFV